MEQAKWLPERSEILSTAIGESELLLAYASSHSIQLDETMVQTLIQARLLLEEQAMSAERVAQETAFWAARAALAQAVRPISAESLKQCTVPIVRNGWLPAWCSRLLRRKQQPATGVEIFITKIQFFLFFPIMLLLLVQMYSLAGSSLVGDLVPRMEKMQILQLEAIQTVGEQTKEADPNVKANAKQIQTTQLEIEIRIEMLSAWSAGWAWIVRPFHATDTPLGNKLSNASDLHTQYQLDRAVVLKAQFVLDILQNFILPMLYGCLGASLFVLRNLALAAKEHTFDLERQMGYTLRIYMGSLCGLVIGWIVPNAAVQDASMTQYSLSVLGGYSVDIVFMMLDKIIVSISGSTSKNDQ